MLVLITYDVNTETAAGKARLRKVAKQCVMGGECRTLCLNVFLTARNVCY